MGMEELQLEFNFMARLEIMKRAELAAERFQERSQFRIWSYYTLRSALERQYLLHDNW